MAIRILLITQWFEPEPTFKGIVFARELVRQGFEVEVLTGFPNYPGGKLYPGYRLKWRLKEDMDGVPVTRVPLYPSHNQSAFARVLNYASFAASSLIYGLFFAKRADVIYAYHPPLTVGITAALLRLLRGIPVVYDIQDMWPDTLRATRMINNGRLLRLIGRVCNLVYRRVDQIVVLSPGFKCLLIERGVPANKIEVIYNWADEASLSTPRGRLSVGFPGDDNFHILFAGNIGKAQALDTVLNAAAILQNKESSVCFVILGGGVEVTRLKEQVVILRLKNVIFIPPVSMAEVGLYLRAADALLVHLRKDKLFEVTIPSKTQAYMAAGRPILMAVGGDAADLIKRSGCGLVAESENPQALADAAEALASLPPERLAAMGQRASAYYQSTLATAVGVARFGEIFRSVTRHDG